MVLGKHLYHNLPITDCNWRENIVNESLQEVLRQLQDPAIAVDGLKCAQTIKRYTELREIQAELAKRLGERVVLTF